MSGRPAWLLAVVFGIAVAGVVALDALGNSEGAQRVVGMTVPILTALYIIDHVNGRSDKQDAKLDQHSQTLATVERATNGELTARLDATEARLRAEIAALRPTGEASVTSHPDGSVSATSTQGVQSPP